MLFREQRQPGESFGDFCDRTGFEALRQFCENYVPVQDAVQMAKEGRHRISIGNHVYALLKEASEREGRPMSQITADAIAAYLKAQQA